VSHRVVIAVLASVVGIAATIDARAAGGGPVIVIPGRADVPVIENGIDVTGAVVYRDWGLKRPGADLIIEGGVPVYPTGVVRAFYPATGRVPAYGRKEIEPAPGRKLPEPAPGRKLPEPAPTYYRTWSAGSEPGPATDYPHVDPPRVHGVPRWHPGR